MNKKIAIIIIILLLLLGMFIIFQPKPIGCLVEEEINYIDSLENKKDTLNPDYIPIHVWGCMDPKACNYNRLANHQSNGSCEYVSCGGGYIPQTIEREEHIPQSKK